MTNIEFTKIQMLIKASWLSAETKQRLLDGLKNDRRDAQAGRKLKAAALTERDVSLLTEDAVGV